MLRPSIERMVSINRQQKLSIYKTYRISNELRIRHKKKRMGLRILTKARPAATTAPNIPPETALWKAAPGSGVLEGVALGRVPLVVL